MWQRDLQFIYPTHFLMYEQRFSNSFLTCIGRSGSNNSALYVG